MAERAFVRRAQQVLKRHPDSDLKDRWQEATAFGLGAAAYSYWIRDTDDVANIVWCNDDGIRDITLLPATGETMFNFFLWENIASFESRSAENVAANLGFPVTGDIVVRLIPKATVGHLYWFAEKGRQTTELRKFLQAVLESYVKTKRTNA